MIIIDDLEIFANLRRKLLIDHSQCITSCGVLEKYYNASRDCIDVSSTGDPIVVITFNDPRKETLFRLRYSEYI